MGRAVIPRIGLRHSCHGGLDYKWILLSEPLQALVIIRLSFQLQNAQSPQPARRVKFTVTLAADMDYARLLEATDVAGGGDLLRARGAGKIFAQVSESRSTDSALPAAPGSDNLVSITLRANKALDACHTGAEMYVRRRCNAVGAIFSDAYALKMM